jgi:peptide/nickel transport system permease protein
MNSPSLADAAIAKKKGEPSSFRIFVTEFFKRPSGVVGLLIILVLLVIVAVGPMLSPYDYAQQDIPNRMQGPSSTHPLGTDSLGRDLASRLIYGTRVAMGTAFPAVCIALTFGLVLGLLAGYMGGWVDNVFLVIFDTLQAFPATILALAFLAILGPSLNNVILVIVISFTPGYARITRAQVVAMKSYPHIEVERSMGAGLWRILLVHILPNIIAPMLILLAMDLPYGITVEAGLSFLGLGVQPPTPSWGVILSDGFIKIRNSPWPVIWPSLFIMLSTLGFTMFGEALRDLLDPKMVGSRRA